MRHIKLRVRNSKTTSYYSFSVQYKYKLKYNFFFECGMAECIYALGPSVSVSQCWTPEMEENSTDYQSKHHPEHS